jgi:glutaredoxin 3
MLRTFRSLTICHHNISYHDSISQQFEQLGTTVKEIFKNNFHYHPFGCIIMTDTKVKVYSTSTCPWCVRAKEFLKKKGVPYEDINVGEDENAANEMIEKSGQMGVPVLDIGGTIIVGFDAAAIEKAITKLK